MGQRVVDQEGRVVHLDLILVCPPTRVAITGRAFHMPSVVEAEPLLCTLFLTIAAVVAAARLMRAFLGESSAMGNAAPQVHLFACRERGGAHHAAWTSRETAVPVS